MARSVISSLLGFVLLCAFLEGVSRLIWHEEVKGGPCFVADPVYLSRPLPDCSYYKKEKENRNFIEYRHNSCGLRDLTECDEYAGMRVVAIGDSFTYGDPVPYESIYVTAAERIMSERLKKKVSYINMGVPGYSLKEYRLTIKEVSRLHPDIVTAAVLPNDFFSLLYKNSSKSAAGLQDSFIRKSVFIEFTTHLLYSSAFLRSYIYRNIQDEDSFLQPEFGEAWLRALEEYEKLISEFSNEAENQNFKAAVILIPERIQAIVLEERESFPKLDPFSLPSTLQKINEKYNVETLNFLEALKKEKRPSDLYYVTDMHLTEKGQEKLGFFVADELLKFGQ